MDCLSFADISRYEVAGVRGGNHSFPSKNTREKAFNVANHYFTSH